MAKQVLVLALVAAWGATAWGWTKTSTREVAASGNLRGFGRVATTYESWSDGDRAVEATVFRTAGAAEAETVLGKYLWDQSWNGATAADGLLVTPGGRAFAFVKRGAVATILTADDAKTLADFVAARDLGDALVTAANCPEWMKRFDWGAYGMGGLENFHGWMQKAGAPKGTQLDPREDMDFLRQMGPMHFDNWLQLEGLDNSDGITAANGVYWKAKCAEELGIPYSYRLYMPCNGFAWTSRRFADCMEEPALWMMNGWLRYGRAYQPHMSWYNDDVWKYIGYQTRRQMLKFKNGHVRGWMHPAGELVHQPWYDMHSDYSPAAKASWHAWLKAHDVTLDDASAMYSRADRPFQTWEQVEVPEFATFAGLPEMKLDLAGIFCHNNPWVIIAEAIAGRGEDAFSHWVKIAPSYTEDRSELHKVEPYVYSQMVAGRDAAKPGEGKNSWLTGTAAWNWYAISEYILGIKPDYDALVIDPCIPKAWKGYSVVRRFRGARYAIEIANPDHVTHGIRSVRLDGQRLPDNRIPILPGEHTVKVILGECPPRRTDTPVRSPALNF